jgi:tripartite ATP-independent transporter DctM subunit
MALFLFILFFILLFIGTPIGFVLGVIGLIGLYCIGDPAVFTAISQNFFSAMDSFPMLALPLFLLAGDIMNEAGLSKRIIDFSQIIFGRLRGGLAHVNIAASIIFGGISGAADADIAAFIKIFIPAMTEKGYSKGFGTAVVISSSIIAPIIPPSIIMVIYGALMGVSIAGLFCAGFIPGIMIGFGLMILSSFIAKKRNYPKYEEEFTFSRFFKSAKKASCALIMPVIILGGILGGFTTPTEAAAIAVAYSLFIGFFIYRSLSVKVLFKLLVQNAILMGVIGLIISTSTILAWFLAYEKAPEALTNYFLSITNNKYIIMFLLNVLLLMVGMFMNIIAGLLILAPIIAPVAINLGFHPLHVGVMICVNLCIGLMTPPVGGPLFMAMAVTRLSLEQIAKELWPFILVEVSVLLLIVYIPAITMFIPRLFGFV